MNSFDPDGIFTPQPVQQATRPRIYGKTAIALKLAIEHGVEPRDALLMARNGKPPADRTVTDFRRKVAKYSLTRPAMVKMAHDVVKNTLMGQNDTYTTEKMTRDGRVVTVCETVAPTFTNKLAAAAMVMDRDQPIVHQSVNLNGELKDFMPVLLDDYS
jgi:hypothetical protein